MGAQFNTMSLPGNLSRKEVSGKFAAAQDRDRYENGHSYSGGFGMACGLKFGDGAGSFQSCDAADDWLEEHTDKWSAAIAVRYRDAEGVDTWRIGAWCSC